MRPKIIIFDESTAMLDPLGRKDVINIMERLNREEGLTVINITHYMNEAARADRVVIINDGELIMDGAPKVIFKEVDTLRAIGLEAPQGRELICELSKCGVNIDSDALSEEECTYAILKFIKNGKINEQA
jgi:energy-coupling factor transport system ATP-binding protein